MAIINVTPDSFSQDGLLEPNAPCNATTIQQLASEKARAAIQDGADILDIGGESTRPGAIPLSADQELARVIPALDAICALPNCPPISIDTSKAEVARAAINHGASIVNDVTALSDPAMAPLVAYTGTELVLMHNKARWGKFQDMKTLGKSYQAAHYDDVVAEVTNALNDRIAYAEQCGINRDQITIDPGLGFGKSVDDNLALIAGIKRLRDQTSQPILIGASRKSFIGQILDQPAETRLAGSLAVLAAGMIAGADIIRVH
ncbi:MAG: dihydropteroate synthase, partial [Pseudomonadota bacterium]